MAESGAGCGLSGGLFRRAAVKIRDESVVKNKAVYLALSLDCEGHKHVLGLWIEQSERQVWLRVMNELKNRGVDDFLFAVVDGPRASRTPSPPCSPKPSCRPASST